MPRRQRPGTVTAPISARQLAADLVNAVLLQGRSLTAALEAARREVGGGDPRPLAAAQELSYGVLRHYGRLGFFLDRLAERPLQPPALRGLVLVALYELDSEATPGYAAVNEAVNLASRQYPRAKAFVNAVLRAFLRQRADLTGAALLDSQAHWNFPTWWIERLRADFPVQWQHLLEVMNTHPPMTLRINRRRTNLADYAHALDEAGIDYRTKGECALTLNKPMKVAELPGFAAGLVSVQDLGAQLAAPLLQCRDGMRVLDACAAPGGKTAHLQELHDLDLLALDVDAERLRRIQDNLGRLGLEARLRVADAGKVETWWDGRPFDRILLDAPCTASGVVRRHPDGKWLKRGEDVTGLAAQQARLLDAVWPLLGQGGKLLYATCSLFREENAEQVRAFLERQMDARLDALHLSAAEAGQLLPDTDHDGFFYARFVKT